jgi:mannose-6-phosphate isomerase-like protein (cupin superfamily)
MKKINLREAFGRFQDTWSPKVIGEVNDHQVKLAKLQGEFIWHRHAEEDELFLVVQGRLEIRLRDGSITLEEGELAIVPKGVEHLPVAEDGAHVLLLEPASTVNTGEIRNERTLKDLERL